MLSPIWRPKAGFVVAVLLLLASVDAFGEPLALESEVEEVLSGNGTSAIYIRVFDGVLALPNTYVYDTAIRAGARFQRPEGRVLIGSYADLTDAFLGRVTRNVHRVEHICGLTVLRWHDETDASPELQLVHNHRMYVLFADQDPRLWRAALHLHCLGRSDTSSGGVAAYGGRY